VSVHPTASETQQCNRNNGTLMFALWNNWNQPKQCVQVNMQKGEERQNWQMNDERCDFAVTNEMTDPLLRMACQHLTFPMDENTPFSVTDRPINSAMLTEGLCTHPKIFFCAQVDKPFFATSKHGMVWHLKKKLFQCKTKTSTKTRKREFPKFPKTSMAMNNPAHLGSKTHSRASHFASKISGDQNSSHLICVKASAVGISV